MCQVSYNVRTDRAVARSAISQHIIRTDIESNGTYLPCMIMQIVHGSIELRARIKILMYKRVRTASFYEGVTCFIRTTHIHQFFDSMAFQITEKVVCIPLIEIQIRLVPKGK